MADELTAEDVEMARAEDRASERAYLDPFEQLEQDRRAGDRYERWLFPD